MEPTLAPGPLRLRDKIAPHLPVAAIVAVALALRVGYLLSVRHNPLFGPSLPGYDMSVFHDWAVRIASGQLTDHRAFYQAPLYPYLLALVYRVCGPSPLAACLLQAGLGSGIVALVYSLGRRLFGRAVGLWAAALTAVTPIFPFYEGLLLRATLVTALNLLFLGALFAFRPERPWRGAVLGGLWLGLAALARSNALVLLPVGALWVWRQSTGPRRRRLALAATLCVTAFLTVSPATLHNRLAAGQWTLVESGFAPNWRIGNSYDSTGGYCEPEGDPVPLLSGAFLRLELKKLGKLLSDYEEPNNMNFYHFRRYHPWLRLPVLSWGFFLAFGVAGVWLTRRRWRELWPLYAYCGLYGGTIVAFFMTSRFRLPLWPVTIMLSAVALETVRAHLAARRFLMAGLILLPAALGALICKTIPDSTIQPQYFYNAVLACEKAGRKNQELRELRDWSRLYPDDPTPLQRLAELLFERGDKRGALAATVRLTVLKPDFARGWYGAGRLSYELKDRARAALYFRRWLELEPEAPEAEAVRRFLAQQSTSSGTDSSNLGNTP